jgi:PPK2 family polyphosphate:nucleotide phosphotransferase
MDAGGKDGTVKHVLGAFNPQGTGVTGFKVPTAQEASHDFLWRVHPHAPSKGYIAIFNRSHYEDVLAPRVHGLIGKSVWEERYRHIRNFEQLLADNSTHILKFYLHISREEQLERFAARLEDPQRNWKISDSDYSERPHWNEYMAAYEDAISATSTASAPWYVIPSNHKWYRNLAVSRVIVEALDMLPAAAGNPHCALLVTCQLLVHELVQFVHQPGGSQLLYGGLKIGPTQCQLADIPVQVNVDDLPLPID